MAPFGPGSDTEQLASLIAGGTGTRVDPFRIRACNADLAADAQVWLLRDLGIARRWFWRTLRWDAASDRNGLNSVLIETVEFTPDSAVTTQLRIFFDISAVEGNYIAPSPFAVVRECPPPLTLPVELAWLHFDGARNNLEESATTDISFFYSGPAARASVYLYEKSPRSRTRQDELKGVVSAIQSDQLSDPWPEADLGPFLTKFLLAGQDMTIAAVADLDPYFIKLRITHADEPKLRQMMGDVLRALIGNISLRPTQAT